eukprot:TRINITY_DN18023_c0_g1_i1.p1 TRINITY_DN18023_c0_g1~~TRINITY_DN18023_c0_g1_i1.p1  ORF type:complete len:115 (+),score=14.59 TRINITY_DN18023_c0_g1_i1:88-432(+)
MSWSTGLCSCCAAPGGAGLCVRAFICPCTVVGDINSRAGGPGGFVGGCLGALCGLGPCCLAFTAPGISQQAGHSPVESGMKACCCALCCGPCYTAQVFRECEIKGISPKQMEMK